MKAEAARTRRGIRLLVAGSLILVAGWCICAAAAFWHLRFHRGYPDVRFVDLALYFHPAHRQAHRKAMGDAYVRRARERLVEARFEDAFSLLRAGLSRSPGNLEGRMMLARYYLHPEVGRFSFAADLLIAGLPYASGNLEYLEFICKVLCSLRRDDEVCRVASTMAAGAGPPAARRRIAELAATAHLFRGRCAAAYAAAMQPDLVATVPGRILASRIEWSCGSRAEAVRALENFAREALPDSRIHSELLARYRELGNLTRAMTCAVLLNTLDPLDPMPRLEIISLMGAQGNSAAREAAHRFLQQFERDPDALRGLAKLAAEHGDREVAEAVLSKASSPHPAPLRNEIELYVAEACIVAGDFSLAEAKLEPIAGRISEGSHLRAVFSGLRAIACIGTGKHELGEAYLQSLMREPGARSPLLLAGANRLHALDAPSPARTVLLHAHRLDPPDESILSRLVEVEIELGETSDLVSRLRTLLALRRPEARVFARARAELSRPRYENIPHRDRVLARLEAVLHGPSSE